MPAANTTGKPSTTDYHVGRGAAYFSPLVAGLPGPYRHLGNAPEMGLSIETETLDHSSSLTGLKVIDKQVIISQKCTLSLSLDEINAENKALWTSGRVANATSSPAANVNAAIAGFTEYQMITSVLKGRWYDIKDANGLRALDLLVGDVTVEKSGAPDVAMVVNVDYELDLKFGRILFLPASIVIVDGDPIDVTLAAQAGAKTLRQVQALIATSVVGALKFIEENPANGDAQTEFQFHQISLKAEGDWALISDDWQVMQFTGVAERNVTAGGTNSPTLTITEHDDS